jgi:hypothetical protein
MRRADRVMTAARAVNNCARARARARCVRARTCMCGAAARAAAGGAAAAPCLLGQQGRGRRRAQPTTGSLEGIGSESEGLGSGHQLPVPLLLLHTRRVCSRIEAPRAAAAVPPARQQGMLLLQQLAVVLVTSGRAALTWSWDTVQTYVHCANKTGAWSDAALQAMSKSQFVVLEKNSAEFSPPVIDGCEDKIVAACRQLKAVSPSTDCYMYTESDWARQYYSLGHNFTAHPEWCLRQADGSLVNTTRHDRNPLDNQSYSFTNFAYDFSVAEAREAWVHRVADAVATGFVDGAFIDGNRGSWGSSVLDGCSPAKKQAWSAGLNASHAMLRDRLGPDKVLISNYPTPEALEWCTGGMVERFTPDQHQQDLQALARAGKLADIHAQYFKDMATSPHLAAFLIGMGKWSYFGAGSGWDGDGADACATWLKVWPEYSKPLGEPLGPAIVLKGNGKIKSIWTRKFKSGTHVFLNTTDHPKVDTFCIWWSDGSTTGNHCKPSTLEFVRRHDKSGIETSRAGTPLKSDDASIVWISSPTLPNETVVMQTAAELGYDQLRLCSTAAGDECRAVPLQQSWARGAKFTVPADFPLSVWSVLAGSGHSTLVAKLNDAEPWFSMCDVRAMPGAEMTPPTSCIPGRTVLRVFGRSLAFADGQCVAYGDALTGFAAGSSLSLRLSSTRESNDGTTVTLNASVASCYTAEFQLPSSLVPGNWSWSVQNNLPGASFKSVLEDLEQQVITVSAAPSRQDKVSASGAARTLSVPPGNVKELLHALDAAKGGFTVALPAGTWIMGALDRLTVNDGVTLRGAGESTVLRWPAQTGAMCASFKWVNFGGPGLVSGPADGSRIGWAVTDLQITVTGGLQQNMTVGGKRALCPIVTDQPKQYGSSSGKMRLERLVITSISTDYAGVDMWAGGEGMGAAVVISGSDSAVRNCTVTHLGNCGSNVTPLLSVSGSNRTIISGNTFHFGCTLYSMRSILALLWEHNTALHYKTLGRDGAVIGTFSQPFRVEHVAFFGNKQVDNPTTPPGCTPTSLGGACTRTPPSKCTGHRLETMTLDGGGGAYTGFLESSHGTEIVLGSEPFGNGTGSYQPRANQLRSKWWGAAAMILAGTGAGQWRHIVSHSGRKWVVDREWDVPPDKSSHLQISPMRGKILLVNNSYTTGYTVQLYAMCLGAVVAENTLNSTPLISWGRNPHGWGYQPNWRVELLHNRMPNSHGMTVVTSDQSVSGGYPWVYRGPLASAIVLRHNWVNGSGISIGTGDPATGPSDVLVEWNLVSRLGSRVGWTPIHLTNQTHVMQRANTLFTDNAADDDAAATEQFSRT